MSLRITLHPPYSFHQWKRHFPQTWLYFTLQGVGGGGFPFCRQIIPTPKYKLYLPKKNKPKKNKGYKSKWVFRGLWPNTWLVFWCYSQGGKREFKQVAQHGQAELQPFAWHKSFLALSPFVKGQRSKNSPFHIFTPLKTRFCFPTRWKFKVNFEPVGACFKEWA